MNTKSLLTAILVITSFFFAQSQNYWTESNSSAKGKELVSNRVAVNYYSVYTLDLESLNEALESAPMRGEFSKGNELFVSFPGSDGQFVTYSVVEAPIMHPDLAAKYPGIKSYAGHGVDNPAVSIRFSVSYQRGLHGMIFNEDDGTSFIDPYSTDFTEYMVYSKKDMIRTDAADFECTMDDANGHHEDEENITTKATNDKKLRKYRLALCCNAEYGNLFIGSATTDAAKRANILAQMNITMTRVNGVYEKDLSITMELIANNDIILWFGSTTTDPWSGEFNTKTAQTIDANIGISNYDIGHNFNTSGGGNAGCIACVCLGSTSTQAGTHKGRGMTGRSNPTGDAFDIDYVAHEMGHQFGGYHTMNTCSRSGSGSTEVEPTSGSTIMGYAGICSYNIQANSDDYFAYVNIRDISANVQSGNSSSCAQVINISNNPPTANAGADYTIPKSTAFVLTGTGTDPDGDALTYTWEQNDPAQAPAATAPIATWTVGPMFRSRKGTTDPKRYFPAIASIIANNLTPAYEVVPSVGRTMNFSLVTRDNKTGGGQTANDLMVVTVNGTAGPFTVSAPNTAVTWAAGSTQTVTWNVAGTTASPVSCANVDIFLSTDGGYTYPVALLTNTPNDGTETITVPNNPSTTCRVMVKGANNIFFDISNANFTITGSTNSITSGTISGSPFCAGVAVSVPFTMSGSFTAGNVFTAQLSNATGSFATPVNIGTLTSTTSGTISATIPAGTATGTGYRIRVIASTPATTGSDNGTNLTINASLTPSVVVSGNSTICAGVSTTFTAAPTNGGTPSYQWKLNGANVGTNSPTYTNGAIANGNTVSCVMTSNATCASPTLATSNTITMVVNPIPATPVATSSSPVCAGASINLTTPLVSGASYSWSGPNSYTSTSQNPVITNATTTMAGVYSVSVTQTGCTSLPGSTTVTVTAAPAMPTASSNSPVCSASAINLTTPSVSGATYSWTGPNGFTSTQQNPVIPSATAAMAGTYSVTVLQGACPSTPGSTSILVNTSPVANFNASPIATVCSGFVQFTDNSTGSPSTWLWNFGDGQSSTSQSPSHDYLSSGTYSVTLTAANNCGNNQIVNTNYVTVNVPDIPTGTGATICGAGTATLNGTGTGVLHWFDAATAGTDLGIGTTFTTPSITNTTTYYLENHISQASQYVGPVAAGANNTTSYYISFDCSVPVVLVSVSVTASAAGNRTIELRNSASAVLQTTTVNIPAGTSRINLNFNVPVASGLQLYIGTGANLTRKTTGVSYPYTLAGLVSITGSSAGTTRFPYFFDWEVKEPDCVSARVPVIATVNTALPASVNVTASSSTICSGTNVTFTASPTNGGTTPIYQWSVNGSPMGTNSPTYSNSTLANNDIVTCVMTSNGSCVSGSPATSNSITMSVNSTFTPSVSIIGNSSICSGTSTSFTAIPVNGGTPVYQWQVNGLPVGTNSSTFTSSTLLSGNTVSCIMTSGLACAAPVNATSNVITLTVNPTVTPLVSISPSSSTICSGTSVVFTATPVNGGTPTYQWILNGTNVGTGGDTYTNAALLNSDVVSCVMTSTVSCPATPTATSNNVVMTVNPIPSVDAGADQVICEGTAVTLSGNGATTYTWDNGVTDGIAFIPLAGSITYNVTGTLNGCSNTDQVVVIVNSLPVVSAGIDQEVCAGTTVTLSGSGATTYTWDNGVTDGIAFIPLAGSITYNVTGTLNGCSNTDQVVVTVNSLPVVNAGLDQTVCVGTSVTLSGSGATSYTWDNGITDGVSFIPSAGTLNYTVTGTINGCSANDVVTITVNEVENYSVSVIDPIASVTSLLNATYQWIDCDNGNANIPGETNTDFSPMVNGNYAVVVNQNGCSSTSSCVQITVTGISENMDYGLISIYPNPSHGIINIAFEKEMNEVDFVIENVIGQRVFERKSSQTMGSVMTIDLSAYSKGLYFINIKNQNTDLRYKIILDK
ncbi:MAG: PKD domain-containing protein [Bacteroidia bacterium]|nr:PKD domain-containing protein [Bacteroidia bacterium]